MPWDLPVLKESGDSLTADELNSIVEGITKHDGPVDANGQAIQNLPAPSSDNDAARKKYVDDGLAGKAASSHTHSVSQVTGLQDAIDGKASTSHTHTISDVTGLQTALDGKASTSHTHNATDINAGTLGWARLPIATPTTVGGVKRNERSSSTEFVHGVDGSGNLLYSVPAGGGGGASAWGDLTGDLEDQTDLQAALDGKAASSHTHSIANVTGLQDELDSKLESVDIVDINATGTASGTTYLRGDGSWSTPAIVDLSDVTITTPANGQSLIYASGDWVNKPTYIAPDVYANRPAANTVAPGTRFIPTDIKYKSWTSDGTNWHAEFLSHSVLEPPDSSNWTVIGNGSPVLTDYGGTIVMTSSMGSSIKSNLMLMPIPVTSDWAVDIEFMATIGSGNIGNRAGLVLTDGTNPASISFVGPLALQTNQQRDYGIATQTGTDLAAAPTTLGGLIGDIASVFVTNSIMLRITKEGSFRRYYWSMNGIWRLISSQAWTFTFTPTHIGYFTQHGGNSGYEYNEAQIIHWKVS